MFQADYFREKVGITAEVDAERYYLKHGKRLAVDPSPFFDSAFYVQRYPDVARSRYAPLVHYLLHGWREWRAPSALFDREDFLKQHPLIDSSTLDAAQACILMYGSYAWSPATVTSRTAPLELPEDPHEACRRLFDPGYYLSHYQDSLDVGVEPFTHYMTQGFRENRNPSASFDSYYYKHRYLPEEEDTNPLLHYVEGGRKLGHSTQPSSNLVIDSQTSYSESDSRLCVHVHCFYPELIGEIAAGLANFPATCHAVVTVCREADRHYVSSYLARTLPDNSIDVLLVPNRGRDLAPFLVGCAAIWKDYDLVAHIHTKKSPHLHRGEQWRRYLFKSLMGSRAVIAGLLQQFADDPQLGLVYPQTFFSIRAYVPKSKNEEGVRRAAALLGIDSPDVGSEDYPVGSMCLCRTAALARLVERIDCWSLFEPEADQVDGTFAHALERLLGQVPKEDGYTIRSFTLDRLPPLEARPALGREIPDSTVTQAWPRDTVNAALHEPQGLTPPSQVFNPKRLNIHWVIPNFIRGAGGHMTIFRMVRFLECFGHRQTIWIQNVYGHNDPDEAKARIREWYSPIGQGVHVHFLAQDLNRLVGDVLIATDCWTAFPVSQARQFKERFYFIQDMESEFHAAGSNRLIAESTYDLGLPALCAGAWLEHKMQTRGTWARRWDLCADSQIYVAQPRDPLPQKPQIALYARPYTPRRAVEVAIAGLELLARRGRTFKVHLFGEDNLNLTPSFEHELHGVLNHEQLAELYQRCDIGVAFSTTNHSLISLEMAACGLPVVELDVESIRAVFSNDEVTFAKPTPIGVANALEQLMDSPDLARERAQRALALVTSRSWEQSARDIEAAILERLSMRGFRAIDVEGIQAVAIHTRRKASVFIPTYNAGPALNRVLERLTAQRCDFDYDVLIIDSGSTDGTQEIVRRFQARGVRLEEIAHADFQHGRTRNLGVAMTEGEYVALLTQDALPKNTDWLARLIAGFDAGPSIAGVTGRHESYPEHGPFIGHDLRQHFDLLALMPKVIDAELGLPSLYHPGSIAWQMLVYFFSDNNAAISRRVWTELPYPEVPWGEDYLWARQVIQAGFQKAYADDAVVYHSHDHHGEALFERAMQEGRFWMQEFGVCLHPDAEAAIQAFSERDLAFAMSAGLDRTLLPQRLAANASLIRGRIRGAADSRPCQPNPGSA